jgi:hypothetical protein
VSSVVAGQAIIGGRFFLAEELRAQRGEEGTEVAVARNQAAAIAGGILTTESTEDTETEGEGKGFGSWIRGSAMRRAKVRG